jgi:hypothetical protein
MGEEKIEEEKCDHCGKRGITKNQTIKEKGVVGYYDVKVKWCVDCVIRHNRELLENWGTDIIF